MAEDAVVIAEAAQPEVAAPQKSAIEVNAEARGMTKDQLEHLAFGTPLPAVAENIVDNGEGAGASAAAAETKDNTLDKGAVDYNAYVKEQFGFETVEEAKAQFAELKKLAETGAKGEPTFADETSKKIYNNILKGNLKEVKSYLEAKEVVDTLDTLAPEQKLKMFIKMQYPMYKTDALLDAKFNKTYAVDETPYMDEDTVIDPVGLELAKAEAAQKMQDDLQKADEYFTQYKGKISLPDITAEKPTVDDEYEAYKARTAKGTEDYQGKVLPAITSLKEEDVKSSFKINDPKNQMVFDVEFAPTKEDFEDSKKQAANFWSFVQESFFDKEGNLYADKLAKNISFIKNPDKFVQSLTRQAVNAERKRVLAQNTPNNNGNSKSHDVSDVGIKNDLQKKMDHAMSI